MTAIAGTRRRVKELVDGTLRVEIDVEPTQKAAFLLLFPEIDTQVAMAPLGEMPLGDVGAALEEEREVNVTKEIAYGQLLNIRRYWHNPKLWDQLEASSIYTQEQHKKWIEQQPCYGAGIVVHDSPRCEGQVCAHHVASASLPAAGPGSSNPRKPPHWYTLPLCHRHHMEWVHGEATRGQKEKMLRDAVGLTAGQAKFHMKHFLGVESSNELTPARVEAFELDIGLKT